MSDNRVDRLKSRLYVLGQTDAKVVFDKDINYGHSWKRRGGVGAFMVLARKWDRLEERLKKADAPFSMDGGKSPTQYDLFEHIEADPRDEGVIDDIRDLRRYLMLVEEEMIEQKVLPEILWPPTHTPTTYATIDVQDPEDPGPHCDPTGQENPFGYNPEDDNIEPPYDSPSKD